MALLGAVETSWITLWSYLAAELVLGLYLSEALRMTRAALSDGWWCGVSLQKGLFAHIQRFLPVNMWPSVA